MLAEGDDRSRHQRGRPRPERRARAARARRASRPWGKDLPWVVYTRRQERAVAQKAFELGVLDYVSKPANADVLVAKLKALLDQRASVRSVARRERLAARDGPARHGAGALPRPQDRRPAHPRAARARARSTSSRATSSTRIWGELRAEPAFYAMLKLEDGDFALDPAVQADRPRHPPVERGAAARRHAPHGRGTRVGTLQRVATEESEGTGEGGWVARAIARWNGWPFHRAQREATPHFSSVSSLSSVATLRSLRIRAIGSSAGAQSEALRAPRRASGG